VECSAMRCRMPTATFSPNSRTQNSNYNSTQIP
jgi:hypothetical protein